MSKETAPKTLSQISAEKAKSLEATFAQIDKQFGKGSVMLLGAKAITGIEVISTGSILIDDALGVRGLPRGRIIEIFGPEASGKTTMALQVVAQAQRQGGVCAFIDAEHAMDPVYTQSIGVNVKELIISQPDYGEQALDIAEMLIRSGAIDVLIIDSVAALVPKAELEGDMGDQHVGLQARLMSQALRKLTPIVHKSKTILIFINQIRSKIGGLPFASNETTTGGNALKFYASVRLDVRRIATLKKQERAYGNRVAIKVVKNKVASPFKRAEVDLIFGKGVSRECDLLDAALSCGIVQQSGSWLAYNGEKLGQGKDNCVKALEENSKLFDTMYQQVLSVMEKNQGTIQGNISEQDTD